MKYITLSSILVALLWLGESLAATLPPPYEARYEGTASVAGLPVSGELKMTLDHNGDDRYSMTSDIRPGGIGALLASMSEQVSGEVRDGEIRPGEYRHRVEGLKESHTRLDFDWQKSILHARHEDEQASLPLAGRVVDPLSLNLQVMTDLLQGYNHQQYTYVDETELKTYRVTRDGEEMLKTALGELRTLRIRQQRPGSSRITTFWFAPSLNYLPVRIRQEKKGKEVLKMEIRDFRRTDGR